MRMRDDHALHRSAPAERMLPCEHLVADEPQRVDVGACIDMTVSRSLLGRHVRWRAHRHSGAGEICAAIRDVRRARRHDRARHAEVRQHGVPFFEQDVFRLDVAVDDALSMRVRERIRDLDENPNRIAHRKLSDGLDPVPQRLAADVRHDVPEEPVS